MAPLRVVVVASRSITCAVAAYEASVRDLADLLQQQLASVRCARHIAAPSPLRTTMGPASVSAIRAALHDGERVEAPPPPDRTVRTLAITEARLCAAWAVARTHLMRALAPARCPRVLVARLEAAEAALYGAAVACACELLRMSGEHEVATGVVHEYVGRSMRALRCAMIGFDVRRIHVEYTSVRARRAYSRALPHFMSRRLCAGSERYVCGGGTHIGSMLVCAHLSTTA